MIMLDSISFYWDPIGNDREDKFELIIIYKSINGDTSVPRSYVTKNGSQNRYMGKYSVYL